ncbi:MAG: YggT family protein [Proteobacteria bacterium]|jgi:YggT family protein|nr:YggT family protein [Pseudomonadota bacterium]
MHAILDFAEYVVQAILQLLLWIVILYALASTLISFEIINLRNRFAYSIWRALEAVALPMLRPIRRIMPRTGPVDFTPFVFVILVIGVSNFLIPALFRWLHALAGPIAY